LRCIAWLFLLCPVGAWGGQTDDDAAALGLPGAPAVTAADVLRSASLTIEGDATEAAQRGAGELNLQRLSLDARFDRNFFPTWRVVVAERLDSDWAGSSGGNQEIGTLKEAYVGWQPQPDVLIDAGRINDRQGVGYGYNPTDFFRADAVRSLISLDPNSLRQNRLGTVMLRGQELWDTGSVTASYAPRFPDHTSAAALDPDWGATNSSGRWLLSLSQQLAPGWAPQWLAFGEQGRAPQLGMNLTAALGSATVAYLEVSAGRATTLLAQALDTPQRDALRARATAGLTYSFANKLSVTAEYEYNGAGADSATWSALRSDLVEYATYRRYALTQQDLATQSNAFVYASWQDFVFRHLDVTAFLRADLIDHSLLPYVEARRRWDSVDVALRWQTVEGNATSDFGASTQRQTWQVLFDYYL